MFSIRRHWYAFDALRVTFHLRTDLTVRWNGIYGFSIRLGDHEWFVGVVKSAKFSS